jgi:cell wall-associated NlpC family hydrolase
MRKIALFMLFLALSALEARDCDIEVKYINGDDGSITLHISHSKNCKMSVSLTENGSSILFKPESRRVSKRSFKRESRVKNSRAKKGKNLSNDELIDAIIATAKSRVGSRYKPGATGPNSFDCSGFVYYCFRENGIKVPRVSKEQAKIGKKLKREELKKGDIVCFDTAKRGRVNHTGIYLGDGRFIHSSSGRAYSVTVSNLDKGFYKEKFRWGVRVVK